MTSKSGFEGKACNGPATNVDRSAAARCRPRRGVAGLVQIVGEAVHAAGERSARVQIDAPGISPRSCSIFCAASTIAAEASRAATLCAIERANTCARRRERAGDDACGDYGFDERESTLRGPIACWRTGTAFHADRKMCNLRSSRCVAAMAENGPDFENAALQPRGWLQRLPRATNRERKISTVRALLVLGQREHDRDTVRRRWTRGRRRPGRCA